MKTGANDNDINKWGRKRKKNKETTAKYKKHRSGIQVFDPHLPVSGGIFIHEIKITQYPPHKNYSNKFEKSIYFTDSKLCQFTDPF